MSRAEKSTNQHCFVTFLVSTGSWLRWKPRRPVVVMRATNPSSFATNSSRGDNTERAHTAKRYVRVRQQRNTHSLHTASAHTNTHPRNAVPQQCVVQQHTRKLLHPALWWDRPDCLVASCSGGRATAAISDARSHLHVATLRRRIAHLPKWRRAGGQGEDALFRIHCSSNGSLERRRWGK